LDRFRREFDLGEHDKLSSSDRQLTILGKRSGLSASRSDEICDEDFLVVWRSGDSTLDSDSLSGFSISDQSSGDITIPESVASKE
jgi:hypothetical protein